jgi:pyridoxine 5'-phosphate synthase PdxJ
VRNARGGRQPDPVRAALLADPVVELHTGWYCDAVAGGDEDAAGQQLDRLRAAAAYGGLLGEAILGWRKV